MSDSDEIKALGRYRILGEIAAGGMASVSLAHVAGPGGYQKAVALKLIHERLVGDREFVAMFLDEARLAARIQHPNVCGVIDFGEVDGRYFLALEYLLGEPLDRVIGKLRELPADHELRQRFPDIAAYIVAQVAEGLHAAHELCDDSGDSLGVVHRDVNPANVMVGYDGSVRVLDFGIARARHRLQRTQAGVVKGKLRYMAPEQVRGDAVDRRVDVFAAGILLFELCTLQGLFGRADPEGTVRAILTEPIPGLCETRPGLSLGLDEISAKALARDPARRYQTARDLGRDLLQHLVEEGKVVGPADVAECLTELFPGVLAERRVHLSSADGADVEAKSSEATQREATLVSVLAGAGTTRHGRTLLAFVAGGVVATLISVVARGFWHQ